MKLISVYGMRLEKERATHSSVLARRIPGTGEPGGLPSMGSHRVGHDWSDLAAAWYEIGVQVKYLFKQIFTLELWKVDPWCQFSHKSSMYLFPEFFLSSPFCPSSICPFLLPIPQCLHCYNFIIYLTSVKHVVPHSSFSLRVSLLFLVVSYYMHF